MTKKLTKKQEKKSKIIFGSELSEANNEPTFRIHQKSRKKSRKIIFGSELSETNNELTSRFHQKMPTFRIPKNLTKNRIFFWVRIV